MAVSDAKKKANSKWDAANMATLACKVKKDQAEMFRQYCAAIGDTVNSALQSYVTKCIADNYEDAPESPVSASAPLVVSEDVVKVKAHITRTGEATSDFIHRAIADTIGRDEVLLKMGISPKQDKK